MSDLLPCPFCGNVKLLYIEHMKETILHPYRVVCDNCGAAGGYQDIGNHIKAWNRRALPAVQPDADSFADLIADARLEAAKAMKKFPQPNYVISKVAEEAGEVVKAAIHCAEGRETAENVRGEMRQVIAMLYRLWVEGDQVHGLAPLTPQPKDNSHE